MNMIHLALDKLSFITEEVPRMSSMNYGEIVVIHVPP